MNDQVKISIDARKNAFNSFELTDKRKAEIDKLFAEIEKLGNSCQDAGDFENKFAASPLNQEYMDMFTKISMDGMAEQATKNAAEGAIRSAIGAKVPTTKAAVHQKAYDAARDIPVVGDAIDLGQKASYIKHLGGLFKKKK
ncbi:hypothetical protein IKG07_00615 [Candidatus Saccharibacteria bacterium]|nr:hypothetical protein [Candidatus Saccharibacteria bacterium]